MQMFCLRPPAEKFERFKACRWGASQDVFGDETDTGAAKGVAAPAAAADAGTVPKRKRVPRFQEVEEPEVNLGVTSESPGMLSKMQVRFHRKADLRWPRWRTHTALLLFFWGAGS